MYTGMGAINASGAMSKMNVREKAMYGCVYQAEACKVRLRIQAVCDSSAVQNMKRPW